MIKYNNGFDNRVKRMMDKIRKKFTNRYGWVAQSGDFDETYFDDEEAKEMMDEMRKEYIEEYGQVDWFDEMGLVDEEDSGDDLYDLWNNIYKNLEGEE